jgi:hypothetical protein
MTAVVERVPFTREAPCVQRADGWWWGCVECRAKDGGYLCRSRALEALRTHQRRLRHGREETTR